MSIQSQINRIKSNVADTYAALEELGATMPTELNSDNLSETAATIAAVLYTAQMLTDNQKSQARTNIGAASLVDFTQLSNDVENVKKTVEEAAANASSALSGLDSKAPTSHASTATIYGKATSSNYGHVKLSASTSSTSGTSGGIAATPSAVKAVKDLFGGKKIITGSATINFGSTSNSVTVSFGYTFTAAPIVLVCQVFDDTNIVVKSNKISTTGFTAGIPGAFSSSGSRAFNWLAIGT